MTFEKYDFQIEKIIDFINSNKSRKVLLQLPDGLKPFANIIQKKILEKTKTSIFIWAGTNFGACDVPIETNKLDFDLIINFGHSEWVF